MKEFGSVLMVIGVICTIFFGVVLVVSLNDRSDIPAVCGYGWDSPSVTPNPECLAELSQEEGKSIRELYSYIGLSIAAVFAGWGIVNFDTSRKLNEKSDDTFKK